MDAITLDHLLRELAPRVRGRSVRRVRAAGAQAVLLELERTVLWLDVGRETGGLYALERAQAEQLRQAAPGEPDARSRQALLHLRKHLEGRPLGEVRRIPGERAIVCEAGDATWWLRAARPPVLTLAIGGEPLAAFGGEPVWPPPEPDPSRAWTHFTVEAVAEAAAVGERGPRALLEVCPELGASIAQRLVRDPGRWRTMREELAHPRPLLVVPAAVETVTDAQLAEPGSVDLWPADLDGATGRLVIEYADWTTAAATSLALRIRGACFAARRRPLLSAAAARVRRAQQLERHLGGDLEGLADEETLRRHGEALLAAGSSEMPADGVVDVADPYDPAVRLRIRVDPQRSVPANADRLFEKARRTERARAQVGARLDRARADVQEARAQEELVRGATDLADLPEPLAGAAAADPKGLRRFLTSRGLMMIVGRGARENHELTFRVAKPEDYWLHARDVPGAHVILRDPERRAAAEDLREAAEVAAYFSGARTNAQVDVHVARRKHVQPAGGGPGRVRVGHSETERVAPRDPEGRLRRR